MKIHLISDVHAEMKNVVTSAPDGTDVVVLAGDIHIEIYGIEWAIESFGTDIPIVYICGNHEFYDSDISVVDEIVEAAKDTNVHFLNNRSVVIKDVRFIGSTLWTSFNDWSDVTKISFFRRGMNDYKLIKARRFFEENPERIEQAISVDQSFDMDSFNENGCRLLPVITYLLHKEAMSYLTKALAEPFDGQTVVVTHHAPSYQSVSYRKIQYEDAYATSLDYFISKNKEAIDVWFHGHLHQPVHYWVDGVPIVSNPRDYPIYGNEAAQDFIYEL